MSNSYPAHTISVRSSWGDPWTPMSYLQCESLTSVCNPDISQAFLTYRYGLGQRFDQNTFDTYVAQNLTGNYVKIDVTGLGTWYGTIIEKTDEQLGTPIVNSVRVPNGSEHYIAYGLEFLLDRVSIRESIVSTGASEQTIGRAIAFNSGRGWSTQSDAVSANASTTPGSKSVPIFADALDRASTLPWTAQDIFDYLLAYFPPRDKDGTDHLTYKLDAASQLSALAYLVPTLDVEGQTVKWVLDTLINRQRGLGWKIVVDEQQGEILINVFTFADTLINLPSGAQIPANANQTTLDYDLNGNTVHASLRDSEAIEYDQVIVRGARRGSVFTISQDDATLEADWTTTLETAYETAASTATDYASLSTAKKRSRNNDARAADKFRAVYAWFQMPADWDGQSGDGLAGTKFHTFPQLDTNGDPIAAAEPVWNLGIGIEEHLPLLKHHDYSGDNIDLGTVTDDNSGSTPEYLEPFVLFRTETGTPNRYQHCEHLAIAADASDDDRAHTWSANLSMRPDRAAFEVRVVGGHQHFLAKNDFTALADETFEDDQYVDWQEMVATVYALCDTYVEKRDPDDASVSAGDVKSEPHISIPDAHLDWVVEGTIVGIEDGELLHCTTGAFVRDDRDRLADTARTAWQWYGTPRKVLEYSQRGLLTLQVGQLITTVGSGATLQTVNTVITDVSYDLRQAATTLRTQFANLDAGLFT